MKVTPLQYVGVELHDLDITKLTEDDYAEIRAIYDEELIVLIRDQEYKSPYHFALLVEKMGLVRNLNQLDWFAGGSPNTHTRQLQPSQWTEDPALYPVQRVTGHKRNGKSTGIFGQGILDWHSNLNSRKNANGVALQAYAGVEGTSTSYLDLTKAYADLSPELKQRCEGVMGHFKYSPEIWSEGTDQDYYDMMLAAHARLVQTFDYTMPLVHKNLTGTKTGLYFHFLNSCSFPTDPELFGILKANCVKPEYIYTHFWKEGDIMLMNQLLTLHKRDQDGEDVLDRRVLHRYTFHR